MDDFLQIVNDRAMSDAELLAKLRSGIRFRLTLAGDWVFLVTPDNRLVLRRER